MLSHFLSKFLIFINKKLIILLKKKKPKGNIDNNDTKSQFQVNWVSFKGASYWIAVKLW